MKGQAIRDALKTEQKNLKTDYPMVVRPVIRTLMISAVILACINPAIAADDSTHILDAINRQICWQVFWGAGQWYKLGSTELIQLRKAGNLSYAWSENLSSAPGVSDLVDFFTVSRSGGRDFIVDYQGENLDSESARESFENSINIKGATNTETVKISLPANCNPQFDLNVPTKAKMLDIITKSVSQYLAGEIKFKLHKYPSHVKIIISNFNIDYPETFVSIPSSRKILVVALPYPNSPAVYSGDYVVNDLFPNFGEARDSVYKQMSPKIIKYGIIREISVGAAL